MTDTIKNETVETPLADSIINLLMGQEGFEEFAALLELPEEQFNLIKEMILQETERSLKEPNTQKMLEYSLSEGGVNMDDLKSARELVSDEIQTKFSKDYSQDKVDFMKRLIDLTLQACEDSYYKDRNLVLIPIETSEDAKLPEYAHEGDGAVDLYSTQEYVVEPGETVLVDTGLKVAVPNGFALLVQPRSGQSLKTKLRVANSPGLIDAPYRGTIGVIIENIEPKIKDIAHSFDKGGNLIVESIEYGKPYVIEKGQKIAQMRLVAVPSIVWTKVDNIGEYASERGTGGFGSTGKF